MSIACDVWLSLRGGTDVGDWSQYHSSRNLRPRLIWSSFGEAGTGKTTFGLQGPGPVVVQSLDYGLEGVDDEFRSAGKDIIEIEYNWNPVDYPEGIPGEDTDPRQEAAIEIRDRLIKDYRYALKHARTLLWDKETQIYPLFNAAEWPSWYKPEPREHGPLQAKYRGLINEAKATDINFGLIQGMKSPWEVKPSGQNGKERLTKTKDRTRRGFAEVEELVHVNIEHYVEMTPHAEQPYQFMFRTGKMRGPGARKMQYREIPIVTFQEFGRLLFPDSAESDWA